MFKYVTLKVFGSHEQLSNAAFTVQLSRWTLRYSAITMLSSQFTIRSSQLIFHCTQGLGLENNYKNVMICETVTPGDPPSQTVPSTKNLFASLNSPSCFSALRSRTLPLTPPGKAHETNAHHRSYILQTLDAKEVHSLVIDSRLMHAT